MFLIFPIIFLFLANYSYADSFLKEKNIIDEIIEISQSDLTLLDLVKYLFNFFGNFLNYKLFIVDKHPVTVTNIVIGLILFFIGLRYIKKLSYLSKEKFTKLMHLDPHASDIIQKISYYIFLILLLLMVLDIANVPLTVFTFVGGALAIGIGFGSQNVLNNFISGIIMMIERPIKIGDIIEVSGYNGRVVSMGARCINLRTGSNIDVLIPNSSMLQNNVINWTLNDNIIRVSFTVGVACNMPTRKVEELIRQALKENQYILAEPEPQVYFMSFSENGLIFEILYFFEMAEGKDKRVAQSALNHRIDDLFRENDISLLSPQRNMKLGEDNLIKVQLLNEEIDKA